MSMVPVPVFALPVGGFRAEPVSSATKCPVTGGLTVTAVDHVL